MGHDFSADYRRLDALDAALTADALECNGRLFVAADKVLAYLAGSEIRVITIPNGDSPSEDSAT